MCYLWGWTLIYRLFSYTFRPLVLIGHLKCYILISNSFKIKSCTFKTRPAAAAVFSCHLFKPAIHSQTLQSFEHLLFLSFKNSCKEWTFSLICLWKLEKKVLFCKVILCWYTFNPPILYVYTYIYTSLSLPTVFFLSYNFKT